ncbi:hypothetical protein [Cryptosporidium hominis TU502]|uniref:hypothetical protein n=1 Tax=Cryptosporidium hominis (strain TU502) TaxID=353151 RepID=UPI0000453096|nr:hypothetical protein [Cryptosporidium hominis TU502]
MIFRGNIRSICRNKQIRDHVRTNNMALFALNCRNYPVKVYNFDGELITTVYMKNQFEEIDEIYSLEFIYSEESSIILGGGKNCVHVYDYNSGKTLEYIVSLISILIFLIKIKLNIRRISIPKNVK